VNAFAVPEQLEFRAFLLRSLYQPGEPIEGNNDLASIDETNDQLIVPDRNILSARREFRSRSIHTTPAGKLPDSPSPIFQYPESHATEIAQPTKV
jgi:hypothetical protein